VTTRITAVAEIADHTVVCTVSSSVFTARC